MKVGGLRIKGLSNKHPLISIICVTFNSETIDRLIKSIRIQKNDSIEFIVIDGESTNNTIDILKANESIIDFWISERDNGIYDAMNKSLNYTKGKWLLFLGADDLLTEDFTKIIPFLKDPNTIYYGNVLFYGKEFVKVYDDYYLTKLNICHQGILYPKAVFEKYKYDQQYKVYADYHLNLQCWKDPQFKFVHIDFLIASFTEGGYSTYTTDWLFENKKDQLFKEYLKPTSYYRYLNRTLGTFEMLKRVILNR